VTSFNSFQIFGFANWDLSKYSPMSILFLLPTLVYGIFLGLSQGMWHLTIIGGLTVAVWILIKSKKPPQENQSLEIGLAGVAVGGKRLTGLSIFWPTWLNLKLLNQLANPPQHLYLEKFLDHSEVLKAGIDHGGELVSLKNIHTLIIGPTGSGKTEFLRNLMESWPHRVMAVDFKGGLGFQRAYGIERVVTNHSDNLEEFASELQMELERREASLGEGKNLEPLILLIDEFASAVRESNAISRLVEDVVSKGRALQLYLFAASQTLSGVSRTVLANCLQRVGLGKIDQVDAMQLGLSKQVRPSFGEGWASAQTSEGVYFSFPLGQSQISRISQSQTMSLGDTRVIDLSRVRVQSKS
jgi:energy-coupling factor transporter ATP-binding protein EcfA2